jgi:hypothetical protein
MDLFIIIEGTLSGCSPDSWYQPAIVFISFMAFIVLLLSVSIVSKALVNSLVNL